MRKYYGSIEECTAYLIDSNHKVHEWKKFPITFVVENTTEFAVEVRHKPEWVMKPTVLNPNEKVTLTCNCWGDGTITVIKADDKSVGCYFSISMGGMIERNYDENCDSDKLHIAPVFDGKTVKIITCENCGPNFGIEPKYDIVSVSKPVNTIKVRNSTKYDIVIWVDQKVVAKIESKETTEIGIPNWAVLYVDTAEEEILWVSSNDPEYKKILRVNGFCMSVENGRIVNQHCIRGPELSEPYIRYLYKTEKADETDPDITIWCDTIDDRLD